MATNKFEQRLLQLEQEARQRDLLRIVGSQKKEDAKYRILEKIYKQLQPVFKKRSIASNLSKSNLKNTSSFTEIKFMVNGRKHAIRCHEIEGVYFDAYKSNSPMNGIESLFDYVAKLMLK
jgi:hypothetical protein